MFGDDAANLGYMLEEEEGGEKKLRLNIVAVKEFL
jgi:hypothetical protein